MNYDTVRHLADSWGLLVMLLVYLALCGWAFRPGSHRRNSDAATAIFKDSDHG